MSATVLIGCDRVVDAYGSTCARRVTVAAADLEQARVIAARRGWWQGGAGGGDRCPGHRPGPGLRVSR